MLSNIKLCPVPLEQQPLQEYNALFVSYLSHLPSKKFNVYLFLLFLLNLFLVIFVLIVFIPDILIKFKLLYYILTILVGDIVTILLTVRLYITWSYVVKRLLSASIFYEESGWYDGQIWLKTPEMLIQDRLVAVNEGLPIVKKIKWSFTIFVIKLILEILLILICT
uniref:Conserved hypothetical plastid protein n=1 Tax=Rhodochaete parvula TaxID=110510 RepID=A0A1X9PV55_9RHOD|nr:conserved hypothetical plastid protein [Rhodochaete parvula]ASK39574.1 hypothetical protein Rhodc_028 [Rhodochaete parvula]